MCIKIKNNTCVYEAVNKLPENIHEKFSSLRTYTGKIVKKFFKKSKIMISMRKEENSIFC